MLIGADMDFPDRLAALRKERGLTQQALADLAGIHVMQIRRYEGALTQPTLAVLRKLAIALHVTTDALIFDSTERGPADDFRLQFEALQQLDAEDKRAVKTLLEGVILRHQAKRWTKAE